MTCPNCNYDGTLKLIHCSVEYNIWQCPHCSVGFIEMKEGVKRMDYDATDVTYCGGGAWTTPKEPFEYEDREIRVVEVKHINGNNDKTFLFECPVEKELAVGDIVTVETCKGETEGRVISIANFKTKSDSFKMLINFSGAKLPLKHVIDAYRSIW